jgi:hypothetical protein
MDCGIETCRRFLDRVIKCIVHLLVTCRKYMQNARYTVSRRKFFKHFLICNSVVQQTCAESQQWVVYELRPAVKKVYQLHSKLSASRVSVAVGTVNRTRMNCTAGENECAQFPTN